MRKKPNIISTLIVVYSVRCILRSVKHEVLRYVQLNLNKLNATHVMYVSFTTVAGTEPLLLII